MTNYIQPGDIIDLVLQSGETAIVPGQLYTRNDLTGIVKSIDRDGVPILSGTATAAGDRITLVISGVVEVTKDDSAAINAGELAYKGADGVKNTPVSGPCIGVCVEDAVSGATTCKIKLNLNGQAQGAVVADGAAINTLLASLRAAGIIATA